MRTDRQPCRGARRPARNGIRGGALIVAVVITVPIMGFSAAMLFVSVHISDQVVSDNHRSRSFNAAEIGVAMAVENIVAGGTGNVSGTLAGGRASFNATTLGVADNKFEVLCTAVENGENRTIEAGVELIPVKTISADLGAAVVGNSKMVMSGCNKIDGRDWDEFGKDIVGPGVYGVQSTATITLKGSAKIAGHGNPLKKSLKEAKPNYSWANGIDEDMDGTVDEEANDGIDNDGDGKIDEDVYEFPQNPDAVVNLPPGSLKAAAIASGTYFTSGSDLDAYIDTYGDEMPGGKVYYLEADTYGPVNWDMDFDEDPVILVIHNSTGDAVVKNWHADFKGLLITDRFNKTNGGSKILGATVVLSPVSGSAMFANGCAKFRYSSAVLGKLPSTAVEPKVQFLSWREVY